MVNLLEKSKGKKHEAPNQNIQEIQRKISELIERIRILEERVKTIRDKINVVNQTALSNVEEIKEANMSQNKRIKEIDEEANELKNIVRQITKSLSSKAKESDVKVLEKYINMMDSTRFISENDVRKIVNEMLDEKNKK